MTLGSNVSSARRSYQSFQRRPLLRASSFPAKKKNQICLVIILVHAFFYIFLFKVPIFKVCYLPFFTLNNQLVFLKLPFWSGKSPSHPFSPISFFSFMNFLFVNLHVFNFVIIQKLFYVQYAADFLSSLIQPSLFLLFQHSKPALNTFNFG